MRLKNLATLVLVAVCGCGHESAVPERPAGQMVYFDLRTRSPVVSAESEMLPAVHPVTGERSLMPGLYCSACGEWHPAPPVEELQRNPRARQCPQCGGAMTADGPWPEADQKLE
jgi:hypothetical protein